MRRWILFWLTCLSLPCWGDNEALAVGDFDADGKPDVVLVRKEDFLLFRNLGQRKFAPPQAFDQAENRYQSAQAFVIRLDEDNRDDLIVERGGQVTAWLGAVRRSWTLKPGFVTAVLRLPGKLLMGFGQTLRFYETAGDGQLSRPVDRNFPAEVWSLHTADWDGDGKPDLAVAQAPKTKEASLLFARDGYGRETRVDFGSHIGQVTGADFNGDGLTDLVSLLHPTVRVRLQKKNGWNRPIVYPADTVRADQHYLGDLNGDGLPDLVAITVYGVSMFAGDKSHGLGALRIVDPGQRAYTLAGGDLDGDGRPDLVSADYNGLRLRFLFNQGKGNFASQDLDFP